MTFLPIVARELRVASRRRATYWVRSGAALALIVLGVWFFLMMRHEPAHEVAMVLFRLLAGASVLYCLLSGVRATADCLSEEKREGTLGLLFLTDLKGYDVVFGKLAATSLNAFYGVLAVVPPAMRLRAGAAPGALTGRFGPGQRRVCTLVRESRRRVGGLLGFAAEQVHDGTHQRGHRLRREVQADADTSSRWGCGHRKSLLTRASLRSRWA